MDVIEVASQIVVVADLVLPESPLPHTRFVSLGRRRRQPGLHESLRLASDAPFDQGPAASIIRIIRGQGPPRMQVIGQHHQCDRLEGELLADSMERGAQRRDDLRTIEQRLPLKSRQREKNTLLPESARVGT